jgi:3-deoxy-manno-octulosonate cytidylyltransferase (CMP-KDO synthetase)
MFRVVIPARFASTRLPGKLLKPLGAEPDAKPMLQWVHEAGVASGAAEVIIATDDERILAAAREFGARACMTSLTHPSGTDRIAEVAVAMGWGEEDIVVNLQGDEPMMPPELVGQVAGLLAQHASAAIATLATRITSVAQLLDPGVVKVVTDAEGRALYFSRAPIPWNRDTAPASLVSQRNFAGARRHVGLYAYRVAALRRVSMLQPGTLEQIERLEQLRALENGLEVRVADAVALPGPHVDTPEDLTLVNMLMSRAEARTT